MLNTFSSYPGILNLKSIGVEEVLAYVQNKDTEKLREQALRMIK